MICLSRAAPLQSSAHSYSRRILPSQVHLKTTCPRQHFAPRFIAQRAKIQAEEAGLGSHRAGGVTQNILAGSPPRAEIWPFQTGVIPPAKVSDHIIIIIITVHQRCELLEHYTYFPS